MFTQKDLDDAGIARQQLANKIGMRYGTLGAKMNGFSPFTDEEEKKIQVVLDEARAEKCQA